MWEIRPAHQQLYSVTAGKTLFEHFYNNDVIPILLCSSFLKWYTIWSFEQYILIQFWWDAKWVQSIFWKFFTEAITALFICFLETLNFDWLNKFLAYCLCSLTRVTIWELGVSVSLTFGKTIREITSLRQLLKCVGLEITMEKNASCH